LNGRNGSNHANHSGAALPVKTTVTPNPSTVE
jgi:hypothetical protein